MNALLEHDDADDQPRRRERVRGRGDEALLKVKVPGWTVAEDGWRRRISVAPPVP